MTFFSPSQKGVGKEREKQERLLQTVLSYMQKLHKLFKEHLENIENISIEMCAIT